MINFSCDCYLNDNYYYYSKFHNQRLKPLIIFMIYFISDTIYMQLWFRHSTTNIIHNTISQLMRNYIIQSLSNNWQFYWWLWFCYYKIIIISWFEIINFVLNNWHHLYNNVTALMFILSIYQNENLNLSFVFDESH